MHPLHRLYRTKLTFLAFSIAVAGVAVLALPYLTGGAGWSWLPRIPAVEIGAAPFATGLIVVAFEYLDREDAEGRALLRLRQMLNEEAPAFRDAVIQGFPSSRTR